MKGPPSPQVFIGFRFRAMERDVAGPGVCEASAPSHARLRAGSCQKLAQAAELPHGLLLLRAHSLLFPLTMLFPSAFANEDLVCFFKKTTWVKGMPRQVSTLVIRWHLRELVRVLLQRVLNACEQLLEFETILKT